MAAILDIVFSIILGGMLLTIIINANDLTAETTSIYGGDVLVQEMIIRQAQFIESEFRNMGSGVTSGNPIITAASDSSITFWSAQSPGAALSQIAYYTGPTSDLKSTENELDRYLYRTVNGGSKLEVGVVTTFHLHYYRVNGDTLTPAAGALLPVGSLGSISEIELDMEVQNPYAISRDPALVQSGQRTALYSSSFWQQMRVASRNFRR